MLNRFRDGLWGGAPSDNRVFPTLAKMEVVGTRREYSGRYLKYAERYLKYAALGIEDWLTRDYRRDVLD